MTGGDPAPVRVLIVDDDVPTRIGLRAILSSRSDIEVVGEAQTGDEAIGAARRLSPDVVLMDIRLPDVDGITATQRVMTASGNRSKVVVLTTFDFEEYAFQSRRAGASAFLLKRAPAEDIIASVLAVAGGAVLAGATEEGPPARSVHREGQLTFTPPITSREREVLEMVAQGQTNAEIAAALHLSIDTVKSHLKHIYGKSGVRDRGRLVVAARRSGFGRGTL